MNASPINIRGRLLAKNYIISLVGQVIPVIIGLIAIPGIVKHLGTDRFGVLAIAWMLLGYFSMFDMGVSRATTKFIAEELGKGSFDKIPRLFWTSIGLNALFGVAGSVILSLLTPLLAERTLKIPAHLVGESKTSLFILAASIPVVLISSTLRGALEARQRFDLVNIVKIPASSLTFIIPFIGVFIHANLPAIVGMLMISRLGVALIYLPMCFKVFPGLKTKFVFDRASVAALAMYGGWVTVTSALGPLIEYCDRFMIGSIVSISAMTYYSAPYEMAAKIFVIPLSLGAVLFPTFSSIQNSPMDAIANICGRSIKFMLLITGPLIMFMIIYARMILKTWLGEEFAEKSALAFQFILIGAQISVFPPVVTALLQGHGRPDVVAKLFMFLLPLNIAMLWVLIHKMGIVGAAVTAAVSPLIGTSILFFYCSKLFDISMLKFFDAGFWKCAALLAVFGVILQAVSSGIGAVAQIGIILFATVAFGAAAWRFVLDNADKNAIISSVAGFAGK